MASFTLQLKVTLLCIALACASGSARAEDPVPDLKSMLSTLQGLKKTQADSAKVQRGRIIQEFSAAAASNNSAIDFYERGVMATQFDGQTREQTQFQEWKKKEAVRLKSREMQSAARLHLAYLALTLQYTSGMEMKELLPPLINYTKMARPELDLGAGKEDLMKQPLASGLFVRWYQIGDWMNSTRTSSPEDNWEMIPGNLEGIYQKTILPELRRAKDPRVIEYWDLRIQQEAGRASHGPAFHSEKFERSLKPQLLWSRAQDVMAIGQKNRAINEMFAIIKNHPGHLDAGKWIPELEQLIKPPPPPVPIAAP